MKSPGIGTFKRTTASLVLALFISQLPAPVFAPVGIVPVSAAALGVQAPRKDQVVWDDVDGTITPVWKSNVLFLMEATATMSFSPKGVMPTVVLNRQGSKRVRDWTETEGEAGNWWETYETYGLTQEDIVGMMENATYGMGALPTAWFQGEIPETERNLYGRERDTSNNWTSSYGSVAEDMKNYKNRYYFPFASTDGTDKAKPLRDAYNNQGTALQKEFSGAQSLRIDAGDSGERLIIDMKKEWLGTEVNYNFTYKGRFGDNSKKSLPYALVFKDPKYWETGWPKNAGLTKPPLDELVPNDSRMYQAKMVLWNLLSEPNLFDNLRIGLASTFLSPANLRRTVGTTNHTTIDDSYDFNGIFRVHPYGSNLYMRTIWDKRGLRNQEGAYILTSRTDYYKTNPRTTENPSPFDPGKFGAGDGIRYKHGIMTEAITGHVRSATRLHGQYYPVWGAQTNELLYGKSNKTNDDKTKSKIVYRLQNRGSLHVPVRDFDARWTKDGVTITQADKIRMWINGLADIRSDGGSPAEITPERTVSNAIRNSQFHYFKDPEIGMAGIYSLPSAIFPDRRNRADNDDRLDRDYLNDNGYIWYSERDNNVNYNRNVHYGSTQFEDQEFMARARYNSGSGEAAGSVIDFFSPPDDPKGPFGKKWSQLLADVSYPIRNTCENNWLIVIASGMELQPEKKGDNVYYSWDAIKNLYDHTAKYKVKILPRNASGNRSGSVYEDRLENPIRTLVIGMVPTLASVEGETPGVKAQVQKMHDNLLKMARAGLGHNVNDANSPARPLLAHDADTLEIAIREALQQIAESQTQPAKGSALESPALSESGQSESFNLYSAQFRIRRDNQWEGYLTRFAVQEDDKGNMSVVKKWSLSEQIAKKRGSAKKLRYWNGPALSPVGSNVIAETGITMGNMYNKGDITDARFAIHNPEESMLDWLIGYDYSYANQPPVTPDSHYRRNSMLADIGQGGIAFIEDPDPSRHTLTGYHEWASGLTPLGPNIYIQTNDGVLHIVNPATGDEKLAIVPPPVLIPSRLATMKTRRAGDKLQWVDVYGPEPTGGNNIMSSRSIPVYTLDGALQEQAFPYFDAGTSKWGWKAQLLAGLGRGGSGFYMMDIGDRDNPRLMWYKEKIGGEMWEMSGSAGKPGKTSGPSPEFMKLGFNSPRAAMGIAGTPSSMKGFVAIAGGIQRTFDLDKNGNEGAVLLMLDPKDGSLIKGFDADDVVNAGAVGNASSPVGPNPPMGMMASEPTLLGSAIPDADSSHLTGAVYAADNRGNIFRALMEKREGENVVPLAPEHWNIMPVATLHPNPAGDTSNILKDSYAIPYGVQLHDTGDHVWLAGGTADLRGMISDSSAPSSGILRNAAQMIFAFRTGRFQTEVYGAGLLKYLSADNTDTLGPSDWSDGKQGWRIPLRGPTSTAGAEYVSTKPLIANGVLYIATFREKKISWTSTELCDNSQSGRIDGESRVFALNLLTGTPVWPVGGKKFAGLDGAKITGITRSVQGRRNRIFFTFDKLTKGDLDFRAFEGISGYFNPKDPEAPFIGVDEWEPSPPKSMKEGETIIQYWIRR